MIEAGLKAQWLDNRLRTNIAAFFNWYDDIQLAQIFFIEDQFGNTVNATPSSMPPRPRPRPGDRNPGAPTEWLSLNAGLGYLDAEYVDFMTPDATGTLFDLSGEALQKRANGPSTSVSMPISWLPTAGS